MANVKKILPDELYERLKVNYLYAIRTGKWSDYKRLSLIAAIFFWVKPSTITSCLLNDDDVVDALFPKTPNHEHKGYDYEGDGEEEYEVEAAE